MAECPGPAAGSGIGHHQPAFFFQRLQYALVVTFAERSFEKHEFFDVGDRYQLARKLGDDPRPEVEQIGGLLKQDKLIRIGGVGEPEFAAFVRLPHRFFHLLEAEQLIRSIEQVVVGHVPRVGHFEGAGVCSAGVQLPQIKIVEAPVSHPGIGRAGALFPFFRAEEAIEICNLVRMADEPVDFLVHEVDEHLAASMGQDLLDQTEWCARPSERIDEGEGGKQAALPHVTDIAIGERGLEGNTALDDHAEVGRQCS